jgi:hypothetical protein
MSYLRAVASEWQVMTCNELGNTWKHRSEQVSGRGAQIPGNKILYCGGECLWVLSVELPHVTPLAPRIFSDYKNFRGRDSSVGNATRYGLDGPGIESRWGEILRIRPDPPWGPPSLQVPRSWKCRAVSLLPVWARVACCRVKPYLNLTRILEKSLHFLVLSVFADGLRKTT